MSQHQTALAHPTLALVVELDQDTLAVVKHVAAPGFQVSALRLLAEYCANVQLAPGCFRLRDEIAAFYFIYGPTLQALVFFSLRLCQPSNG